MALFTGPSSDKLLQPLSLSWPPGLPTGFVGPPRPPALTELGAVSLGLARSGKIRDFLQHICTTKTVIGPQARFWYPASGATGRSHSDAVTPAAGNTWTMGCGSNGAISVLLDELTALLDELTAKAKLICCASGTASFSTAGMTRSEPHSRIAISMPAIPVFIVPSVTGSGRITTIGIPVPLTSKSGSAAPLSGTSSILKPALAQAPGEGFDYRGCVPRAATMPRTLPCHVPGHRIKGAARRHRPAAFQLPGQGCRSIWLKQHKPG
jgi:hypothetical protein